MQLARRFCRACNGSSAVEFALILPLLLLLYLGGVEISQAVSIDRKLTLLARTVSDLVAQAATVTDDDLELIFDAAEAILAPYPANARVVVSSIVTQDGNSTVRWSSTRGGTARAAGSTYVLPDGIAQDNSSVIAAEVAYDYQPAIGYVVTGTLTLGETVYMRPRTVVEVEKQ